MIAATFSRGVHRPLCYCEVTYSLEGQGGGGGSIADASHRLNLIHHLMHPPHDGRPRGLFNL